MSRGASIALAIGVVIATTLFVHGPILGARALSFDDAEYLTYNPLVSNPSWRSAGRFFTEVTRPSTFTGYYHPLSMTLLMLGHAAGGRAEQPRAFHAISLALHAMNAVLVWWLLFRLFGAMVPATLVAWLFALHPLMVEPLAWIGEQKTLLASFFGLVALACYVEHARGCGRMWRVLAWVSFLLALLSKPTVTTLPLLFLVLDAWPLRRLSWRAVLEKWPFFALAAFSAIVTLVSQQRVGGITETPGSELAAWPIRVVYVLGFYLRKVVWPFPLSSAYPQPEPLAWSNSAVLLNGGLAVALSFAAWTTRRRTPQALAAWVFFVVALAPTLAPVKYTWAIAFDQYLYFPLVGLMLLAGWGLAAIWKSPRWGGWAPRMALMVAVAAAGIEAAGARAAIPTWSDSLTLFHHMETVAPRSPVVQHQLGVMYARRGDRAAATAHLNRAIEIEPDYGDAHYNLGILLAAEGKLEESIREFRRAAVLRPQEADVHYNLGLALAMAQQPDTAAVSFRRALDLDPGNAAAALQLGGWLAARGRTGEAVTLFERTIVRQPNDALLPYALASVLLRAGAPAAEVAIPLERAIALRPDWAAPLNDLAWLKAADPTTSIHDPSRALELARRAVEVTKRNDPRLLDTYAVALASARRFREAAETAREAIRLAQSAGAVPLAAEIRGRLELYERGRPFQERAANPPTRVDRASNQAGAREP